MVEKNGWPQIPHTSQPNGRNGGLVYHRPSLPIFPSEVSLTLMPPTHVVPHVDQLLVIPEAAIHYYIRLCQDVDIVFLLDEQCP